MEPVHDGEGVPSVRHVRDPHDDVSIRSSNKATGYSDNDKLIDAPDWPAVRAGGAFLISPPCSTSPGGTPCYAPTRSSARPRALKCGRPRCSMTACPPSTASGGTSVEVARGARSGTAAACQDSKRMHHRYIDDGVSVIILMNLDDADDESIALGVAELYLPDRSRAG